MAASFCVFMSSMPSPPLLILLSAVIAEMVSRSNRTASVVAARRAADDDVPMRDLCLLWLRLVLGFVVMVVFCF